MNRQNLMPFAYGAIFLAAVLYPNLSRNIITNLFSIAALPFQTTINACQKTFNFIKNYSKKILSQVHVEGPYFTQRLIGQVFIGLISFTAIFADIGLLIMTLGPLMGLGESSVGSVYSAMHLLPPHILMGLAITSSVIFWGIMFFDLSKITHWTIFDEVKARQHTIFMLITILQILALITVFICLALWRYHSMYENSGETDDQILAQVQNSISSADLSQSLLNTSDNIPNWIPKSVIIGSTIIGVITGGFASCCIVPLISIILTGVLFLVTYSICGPLFCLSFLMNRIIEIIYTFILSIFNFFSKPFGYFANLIEEDGKTIKKQQDTFSKTITNTQKTNINNDVNNEITEPVSNNIGDEIETSGNNDKNPHPMQDSSVEIEDTPEITNRYDPRNWNPFK